MFDAADRKKLILQVALLLELDQKNHYYCPLYQIIRLIRMSLLFESEKSKSMNDDEVVASDIPPRYLFFTDSGSFVWRKIRVMPSSRAKFAQHLQNNGTSTKREESSDPRGEISHITWEKGEKRATHYGPEQKKTQKK